MGYIKEPIGIDFIIGGEPPLTKKDFKEISDFISKRKLLKPSIKSTKSKNSFFAK